MIGIPCIAFYIQYQMGMAQGILCFKETMPLSSETGQLGVFLSGLASVCDHFALSPEYRLRWLFLSPIRQFQSLVLNFFKEYKVYFCNVGFNNFDYGQH